MGFQEPSGAPRYQFQVDGRPAAEVRLEWATAARDAVAQGYAIWVGPDEVRLDSTQGATIERIR